MEQKLLDFLGIQRSWDGEANQIVEKIITYHFRCFSNTYKVNYADYKDIYNLVSSNTNLTNKHSYFWRWYQKYGIAMLQKILIEDYESSDEMLDMLDMQLWCIKSMLDCDIEGAVAETICDNLKKISEKDVS